MTQLRTLILRRRFKNQPVSPNSLVMKDYRAILPNVLTSFIKEMLLGLMLGDVTLKFNKTRTTASLHFEWGDKHKGYAFYVWHLLYPYCLELPRRQVRINANGNTVVTWCFQTIKHPAFMFLSPYFLLDKGSVKGINAGLLSDAITPVTLAFWFMDDGGQQDYRGYGLQFHTQGFTVNEVKALCDILNTKFGLDCWQKFNKGKPIIAISGKSYDKFFGLVNTHIHESMRYKFPQGNRTQWNINN